MYTGLQRIANEKNFDSSVLDLYEEDKNSVPPVYHLKHNEVINKADDTER